MTEASYAESIELPTDQIFQNLKNAKSFAIDIGGSLAKLAYYSTITKKKSLILETNKNNGDAVYKITEGDESCDQLHFIKFETKYIGTCLDFIQKNLIRPQDAMKDKVVKVTGGGAHKYFGLLSQKLGVEIDREDEMECLIKGCTFLLKNIPDEAFIYQRHEQPEYKFQITDSETLFPYLLVNIGSGVSILKVESETKFERIGGTSMGGGTFWGLGSILTKAKGFDELLELAEGGDHRSVDMLVKDIYGGSYDRMNLPADLIASSFGKAARSSRDKEFPRFHDADIAKSLLISISNDIGQIAYLNAKLHGLKNIYFGGYFIRGHPMTMHTISYAINYWSKGNIQALFLRHEGYLGAIGAFLKGAEEEDIEKYSWVGNQSWSENLAMSSGLQSPTPSDPPFGKMRERSATIDYLELDRYAKPLVSCPLLLDSASYFPDTEDLTQDKPARDYWLQCFEEAMDKFAERAMSSQPSTADAQQRAKRFKEKYIRRLKELRQNPCAYGSLTVRSLLDTREHCMQEFHFVDPYSQQKQLENEQAMKLLASRLQSLDEMSWDERQLSLVKGVLAGNVFDWGAKEVSTLMEGNATFGFTQAMDKLQERTWLVDCFDQWLERLKGPPHSCAVVFVDNSGMDIILGIFPFVQELLQRRTSVILCANSKPALNDVTYNELSIMTKKVAAISPSVSSALGEGRLLVMESGQSSPCLDLRNVDYDLGEKMKELAVDLVILEGMGRAIHTNYHAAFTCEVLKVAVLKNSWLANRLGGNIFSVVFKYEKPRRIVTSPSPPRRGW